jgi:hypothetical protein
MAKRLDHQSYGLPNYKVSLKTIPCLLTGG